MSPVRQDAEAIRLQLVELSEHILRRLAVLLDEARRHSTRAYLEVEATARDITEVQRELMHEVGRTVPRHQEVNHLTTLMRVQDRSLSVLEQLENLPFRQSFPAAPSEPAPATWQQHPQEQSFYRPPDPAWPSPRPESPQFRAPPVPPVQPPHYAQPREPERGSRPAVFGGRLKTQPSVGQPAAMATTPSHARAAEQRSRQPQPPVAPPTVARTPATPVAVLADDEPGAELSETRSSRTESNLPVPVARKEVEISAEPVRRRRLLLWPRHLADRIWLFFRGLPQAVLSIVFLAMAIVFIGVFAKMFMVVADGLTARRGGSEIDRPVSTERLPSEVPGTVYNELKSARGPLVPPTGEAFVIVLSMHADTQAAQRAFVEIRQKMPTTIQGMSPDIQPIETANGLRYRLALAPPMSRDRAFALCAEFKTAGFPACWLRRLHR